MKVMEEVGNLAIVEGDEIASMEMKDLEAMPCVRTCASARVICGDLPTPIPNVAHHSLAQSSEVMREVWVSENSRKTSLRE